MIHIWIYPNVTLRTFGNDGGSARFRQFEWLENDFLLDLLGKSLFKIQGRVHHSLFSPSWLRGKMGVLVTEVVLEVSTFQNAWSTSQLWKHQP